jgi:hypothetical protein
MVTGTPSHGATIQVCELRSFRLAGDDTGYL